MTPVITAYFICASHVLPLLSNIKRPRKAFKDTKGANRTEQPVPVVVSSITKTPLYFPSHFLQNSSFIISFLSHALPPYLASC